LYTYPNGLRRLEHFYKYLKKLVLHLIKPNLLSFILYTNHATDDDPLYDVYSTHITGYYYYYTTSYSYELYREQKMKEKKNKR